MKKAFGLCALVSALLMTGQCAFATATPEEAARLNSSLTPLGAERAGNKDGTIPAWTGTPVKGAPTVKGKPIADPFADEKLLFTITAKNLEQYADKLTEGTKAMLKKYPETYRLNVYKTHRTATAPQAVYDNTFKNAMRAKLPTEGGSPEGAIAGIPFPIPKNGAEVIWNHLLRWRGEAWEFSSQSILTTADGNRVLQSEGVFENQMPYYAKDATPEKFDGNYLKIRLVNEGPPIRVGEGVLAMFNLDASKTQAYVYFTGQRRVRKLPNACCDAPNIPSGGTQNYDDFEVWSGQLDRFNWKLVGKKEMYIPYNANRSLQPTKASELLGARHINPDFMRWELHRVWVVENTLAPGERNTSPKSTYYVDEDSWIAVLGDRQDAKGQLWKSVWSVPVVLPEMPGVGVLYNGFYDLISGVYFTAALPNERPGEQRFIAPQKDTRFTPDALSSSLVR